jgi:regulation of enolase protein 1 (concanavalin A-like superfamily)
MVRPLIVYGLVPAMLLPVGMLCADDPPKAGDKEGERVIFEDPFDSKLDKGWSWLREDPKAWRIGKDGLEIRVPPGHASQRTNVLLRPAPRAKEGLVAEVFLDSQPSVTFEGGGLQCYFDAHNWVALVKEQLGEPSIQLTQRKGDDPTYQHLAYSGQTVWLRLVVSGGKATGFYRATDKEEWKKAAECDLPAEGEFKLGVACGGGPKDAEHWARFQKFRILEPSK